MERAVRWDEKRATMQDVCKACHSTSHIEGFYKQYDDFVINYNEKFAKPGQAIMNMLKEQQLTTAPNFDEEIEWTWFYLWHHEGRRARHGASMMAPDYAHWHGMYDVAHNFYFKFIPEARHYDDPEVNAYIDDLFANDPMHQWFNTDTGEIKKAIKELDKALKIDPGSAEAFAALGLARWQIGQLDAGESALRQAIKLNEDYIPAYLWLGGMLGELGRLPEQSQILQQLSRLPAPPTCGR